MRRSATAGLLATLVLGACAARAPDQGDLTVTLQHLVQTGRGLPLQLGAEERERLERLYQMNGMAPVWLTRGSKPSRTGRAALDLLREAKQEGLRPEHYAVAELDSLLARAERQSEDANAVARADAGLSAALLRFLQHLHVGRVSPRQAGISLQPPGERHDYVELLRDGIRRGDLAVVVETLRPELEQYRLTREALARFRSGPADSVGRDPEAESRVRQLELALERLRWIGDLPDEPLILVNIPLFELTAWRSPFRPGPPDFRTGVIVGKALDTETPVLIEEMRYLVFQPYWNVPQSIARGEILPALERDPDYLAKHDMEIVDGQSDAATPVPASDAALARVAEGELRIRQRPGPRNSLGPVKFMFPNRQNVYLHGTPAQELFDRSRRDFSHGCVRVEDPLGLAEWVMREKPEWTRERIQQAMEDGSTISRSVGLPRRLTVVLFYSTAFVDPDGTVRFARDIYGHDRRLEQALRAVRS